MPLKEGDLAPNFTLDSTSGARVTLSHLRGKRVVLYFYPRDMTPGCTTEACDFRDNHTKLDGAVVLGVSKDSIDTHHKFRGKYKLPFELLTDADNRVATDYGAFGEKMMYGKKILGTIRSTFIIGPSGRIEKIWSPVRVAGHVDAVRAAITGEPVPAKPAKKATKKKVAKKKAAKKKTKAKKKVAKKKKAKKKVTKKKKAKKKVTKKKKTKKKVAKKKKAVKKKATKKKTAKKKTKKKSAKKKTTKKKTKKKATKKKATKKKATKKKATKKKATKKKATKKKSARKKR